MTTEAIISIAALVFVIGAIIHLIRKGRRDAGRGNMSKKDAELIFESDWYELDQFIKGLKDGDINDINEVNEAKIILRLNELNRMKGADDEKLQTLNAEFRRKFSVTLGDIIADHENY